MSLFFNNYVINRFKETAGDDNIPIMTNGYPTFEWDPVVTILDND